MRWLAVLLQNGWGLTAPTGRLAFLVEGRLWAAWAIYWLAMAFLNKSTKRSESPLQRIEHLVPAALGFGLVFQRRFGSEGLARPILPENSLFYLACIVTTALGLLFAVWARVELGRNWSGTITIKANHELIRRGPYRLIRHPIYTGILAALLATATTRMTLPAFAGFFLVLFAFYRKSKREEAFLAQEFGPQFADHRAHTGMFLPKFS